MGEEEPGGLTGPEALPGEHAALWGTVQGEHQSVFLFQHRQPRLSDVTTAVS